MNRKSSGLVYSKFGNPVPKFGIIGLAAPVRHALQGLQTLAARPDLCLDIAEISKRFELPSGALSKCFQRLAQKGLLESKRGPGGGYRLSRDPAKVTLAQVADALHVDDRRAARCMLEERPCRREAPCFLHGTVFEADSHIHREFQRLTLADLISTTPRGRNPL